MRFRFIKSNKLNKKIRNFNYELNQFSVGIMPILRVEEFETNRCQRHHMFIEKES